jgi:hypothetical protein
LAEDPKDQRNRNTGPQKAPDRNRTTGSVSVPGSTKALANKEREDTSFTQSGSSPRERMTGSVVAPKPSTPSQSGERERVTQKVGQPEKITGSHPAPVPPGATTTGAKRLTDHQRQMLSSAFQSTAHRNHVANVVGNTGERKAESDDDDESTTLGKHFDGTTPDPTLVNRDLFKAVQAPVQSREGRRAKNLYEQVIFQFAVGANPRYAPDGPGRGRAHIYVWDVSRAMNCEVPHFIGIKELSLAQTVDWLRHEGPGRGWTRANSEDAAALAGKGQLVIAMPKEIRLKQMAIVIPAPPDPDGRPRLAGAAVKIGGNLSVYEGLGVYAAEYFTHA